MGRIVVISDNTELSKQLKLDLELTEHLVAAVEFADASEAVYTKNPGIIIVDLILDGGIVSTWRQLRYDLENYSAPAIAIVPKDRIMEVDLLAGIDDFIVYPYDVHELEIRIKLILNQSEGLNSEDVIKAGNLVINNSKYEVTVDGWPVVLTLKEYELLKYLVTHPGRVITREMLLDQIWGYNYYGGTRTVDVHIGRLRTKIETGKYNYIRTVRGVGYMFNDEYLS
ncbi:DNA-binding response regulator [Candidatus Poribacteria bacterium]|nr:DNA-binding response regulator [Candidatus Poribacteria bacterium]